MNKERLIEVMATTIVDGMFLLLACFIGAILWDAYGNTVVILYAIIMSWILRHGE